MQVGDLVQTIQGSWRKIVAITPLEGQETVYNFTVDQNHDYFVGESGFLVHNSCGCDYRKTFFDANPEVNPKGTIVHHAIEQQVQTRYPGLFSTSEIDSVDNLRGIPTQLNPALHLGLIREIWNDFYRANPCASREDFFFQQRDEIDDIAGSLFTPPVGGGE